MTSHPPTAEQLEVAREPQVTNERIAAIATKVIDAYEAALGTETNPYEAGAIALRAALTPKGPTP